MKNFYRGKKVLITGHTGFKGGWLTLWLQMLGAQVVGYALPPETRPSFFTAVKLSEIGVSYFGNILDPRQLTRVMQKEQPQIIFHLAAQALVRRSYREPLSTYQTNIIGTLNVLEAARSCRSVKAVVNVTTDKCYENQERLYAYQETDPLGGYDPYSSSKACAEILSSAYRRSFLADGKPYALATARAGNVIGGGDWAQERLLPDCVRAINANEKIIIRHPHAIRPWQHVLEPLSGYLLLGENLSRYGNRFAEAFNFGPNKNSLVSVAEIVKQTLAVYGKGKMGLARGKKLHPHEAGLLMLNNRKAKRVLKWSPRYATTMAIEKTVAWYQAFYAGKTAMRDFSHQQITEYSR